MRAARFAARHAFDVGVLVVAVLLQIEVWSVPVPGPKAALVPGMFLATVPLLLRRRFPLAAPACVFAALAGMTLVDSEATASTNTLVWALFLAFWSVGAHAEPREAVAGLATGYAAIIVVVERDADVGYADADTISIFLVGGGLWLAAVILRRWARRDAELEGRAIRLESERDERERAAVAAERRRIARDLHDVIAHSVSVMIVQAGAARLLLAEQPARAAGPLLAVEEAGRQALAELRRLLGMLRVAHAQAALTPQPGLAELEALVAQTRAAGLPVDLAVEGEPRALPRGVDLAAYRIVQEALTNARKHAGPAQVRLVVRYEHEALELNIADDGGGPPEGDSGGHGLVGMRERVALYGGELNAGPGREGGFEVVARLPLEASRSHDHGRVPPAAGPRAERGSVRVGARSLGPVVARRWFDGLVILVAVVSEAQVWLTSVPGPRLVLVPGALLWTLPLLLRSRFPFAAPVFCFVVQSLSTFGGDAVGGVLTAYAALLLTFWAVGAHNTRPQALAGVAIGLATIAVATERDVRLGGDEMLSAIVIGTALAFVAYAVQRRDRRAVQLEERAEHLERVREERERAAVAEERVRIARELHDVVAHCVSVMTVQAGAARLLLDEDPRRALEPLLAVEETGRQALAEMRRLLEILRRDTTDHGLDPEPGMVELRALVERCERAGLLVELAIEGEPETALAPGVDLAAYRVVQEALTNAIKHAGPARAWVTVRYAPQALELEIGDDGRAMPTNGGHGHGLVGMRERVALYGGDLEAGPRTGGGYAVHARFPLEQP